MIDRFKDRLSEYLDGDLDPRDEALIEEHLVDCATCRATLAELRAVVARATALPPAEPKADLWSDIRARIEADASPTPASGDVEAPRGVAAMLPGTGAVKADPRSRTRRRRRISFSVPQLAAASVALALASGTGVWVALSIDRGEPVTAASTRTVVENPAVVQFVDTEQRSTIAELERVLAAQRDSLDPVTVAVLESNLKLIDAAIAEAVAALRQDPGNSYLNRHLGQTVRKKIDVLRRAAEVARTEI